MITLKELIHATADTIKIDWLKVEETIGFPLHYDLKNFYSRILCAEQKTISGDFILNETDFIQKTGNDLIHGSHLMDVKEDYLMNYIL